MSWVIPWINLAIRVLHHDNPCRKITIHTWSFVSNVVTNTPIYLSARTRTFPDTHNFPLVKLINRWWLLMFDEDLGDSLLGSGSGKNRRDIFNERKPTIYCLLRRHKDFLPYGLHSSKSLKTGVRAPCGKARFTFRLPPMLNSTLKLLQPLFGSEPKCFQGVSPHEANVTTETK